MLIIIQKRSIIYLMVLFTIKYIKTERKIAMKTLIVGRTAHGKDYLRKILEDSFGWKFVKSRTTRPPRYEGENTHIFITNEEADNTPESEIIAKTQIGDIRYFATKEDLDNADGYIIDPNGVDFCVRNTKMNGFRSFILTLTKISSMKKQKNEQNYHLTQRKKWQFTQSVVKMKTNSLHSSKL